MTPILSATAVIATLPRMMGQPPTVAVALAQLETLPILPAEGPHIPRSDGLIAVMISVETGKDSVVSEPPTLVVTRLLRVMVRSLAPAVAVSVVTMVHEAVWEEDVSGVGGARASDWIEDKVEVEEVKIEVKIDSTRGEDIEL